VFDGITSVTLNYISKLRRKFLTFINCDGSESVIRTPLWLGGSSEQLERITIRHHHCSAAADA